MVEIGPEIGVEVMSFYTFSTENWNRPHYEVNALMDLLLDTINKELEDLIKNDVSLRVIGDLNALPPLTRSAMEHAIKETAANKGLKLVLALNYSGRSDILKAVGRMLRAQASGQIDRLADGEAVEETVFERFLDTQGLPDPDLLIRTSGEMRLSNFMLYQLAYTELVVTKRFWPEFSRRDLFDCIAEYQNRERRFGKISEQMDSEENHGNRASPPRGDVQ